MKNKTYSIRELAEEFKVTHRAIRHYEDVGLLSPQRQGRTRVYAAVDRTRLKLILRGKRLGLSLTESRQIINMYEPGKNNRGQLVRLMTAIQQQREQLHRQLSDIHRLLLELDEAESSCRKTLDGPTLPEQKEPTT